MFSIYLLLWLLYVVCCMCTDVNVAGVRHTDITFTIGGGNDLENWDELYKKVIDSAHQVKLKGYTSWAIGMSITEITQSISYSIGNINAVSILVRGYHGIEDEVYLSLPPVLGVNGVTDVVMQPLTENETAALQKSAKIITTRNQILKLFKST